MKMLLKMKIMVMKNKYYFNLIIICLIISAFLNAGCESPTLKANNAAPPAPENKQTQFEQDLQTMRTANFEYVFVVRRKDDAKLDSEDKTYLKANLPPNTNRVLTSDEGKVVIAGSHFIVPPENLEILQKRFKVEDYSEPKNNNQAENTDTNK